MASSKFESIALPVEQPARLTILDPKRRAPLVDAKGEPAWIELYSSDSAISRRHRRALQQRSLNTRGRSKVTPEEIEEDALDLLAALTSGWRLLNFDGSPLEVEFSIANARELYAHPGMNWLREQVDEFAGDRANFSQASSTS